MVTVERVLCAWALLAAGFSWVAWWRLRPRRAPAALLEAPPVLLLRPVDLPSPLEFEALAAPIGYPGPLEQRVLSPTRPPLPPHVGWLHSDPAARNRKVGHLLRGLRTPGPADRVVLSVDADVRVDAELIAGLVAASRAGAVLAWAAPVPSEARGFWARAARGLLARSHHSFLALAAMPAGAPTVCGKAVALGAAAQALLPELDGYIGEDLELSTRLSAAGHRVAAARSVARVLSAERAGPETLGRFTRWMQVLRAHRPALAPWVPLLIAPTPVLLPLLLGVATPIGLGAAAVLAFSRTLLAARLGARSGIRGGVWEWLPGEALLLAAFAAALGRRTVAWRGRRFTLGSGGQMTPVLR